MKLHNCTQYCNYSLDCCTSIAIIAFVTSKLPAAAGLSTPFLREIAKIAECGLRGDSARVAAYTRQLVDKLQAQGDERAASYLAELLNGSLRSVDLSSTPQATARLPVDGESRLALADEEQVHPSKVPLVLSPAAARAVEEFVRFVTNSDKLEAHGVGMAPSLLVHGPPGTGKTCLARVIAGRLGLPLVTARSDTLISSFLGSTSKNIRQLFDHVAHRHCILFLDELDAFAKMRDDAQELGELKRVVVSLLQNIDSLDRGIVLLAATNHEHLLDPAIWRRFTYRVQLGLPGIDERRQLLELYLGQYAGSHDIGLLAALTETMSGADIRNLVESQIREAVVSDASALDEPALIRRIIQRRLGSEVPKDPTADQLRSIRKLAPRYLNGIRLAELFDLSASTVSRRLSKEPTNAR